MIIGKIHILNMWSPFRFITVLKTPVFANCSIFIGLFMPFYRVTTFGITVFKIFIWGSISSDIRLRRRFSGAVKHSTSITTIDFPK